MGPLDLRPDPEGAAKANLQAACEAGEGREDEGKRLSLCVDEGGFPRTKLRCLLGAGEFEEQMFGVESLFLT